MKKLFIAITICIATQSLMAQDAGHALYSLQYSVAYPMGDLNDFISKTSFRGFSMEFRKMVNDHVLAGLEFGWNVFYAKMENATESEGTITLTGTQFRYLSSFPMLVEVGYSTKSSEQLSPYALLGIGTIYHRSRLDVGIWEFSNEAWHFALKPEVGLIYKLGADAGVLLNVKYYDAFKTSDTKAITYLTTNLGFIWIF